MEALQYLKTLLYFHLVLLTIMQNFDIQCGKHIFHYLGSLLYSELLKCDKNGKQTSNHIQQRNS